MMCDVTLARQTSINSTQTDALRQTRTHPDALESCDKTMRLLTPVYDAVIQQERLYRRTHSDDFTDGRTQTNSGAPGPTRTILQTDAPRFVSKVY